MGNKIFRFAALPILLFTLIMPVFPSASAEADVPTHYFGTSPVNIDEADDYSGSDIIEQGDPHYGWRLGYFFVSGYTRETTDENGNCVFLKTVGDTVSLSFVLEQDIDCLNGDSDYSIYEEDRGYDEYFGIEKGYFGRGTLIIRKTDYQNYSEAPQIYADYLPAITVGAETNVDFFEEGDYEVALDYEIKDDPRQVFGFSILPSYSNYRIFFKFSVRNGNCMVFPKDADTHTDLMNSSFTENGFYLDLARSRYLEINIKKEVLTEGATGLTEDVRFNRPAKDGDLYTEEGIYTITVHNRYTNQQTEKKIYVGTDSILKAYVTTGQTIDNIRELLAQGAQIAADGTIILPLSTPPEPEPDAAPSPDSTPNPLEPVQQSQNNTILFIIIGLILLTAAVIVSVLIFRVRKKQQRGENH